MQIQNKITHVALVLDASASMYQHRRQLVQIADAQIAYLAKRSQELDHEVRVSVYMFSDSAQCLIYDKDVLRLPSIADLYYTGGMTALIDATIKSQEDLAETAQRYGDHSFLTFVLTDGQENASRHQAAFALAGVLRAQSDHWTVAVLVPDMRSKHDAKQFGFPADNIAIWDTTTNEGLREAGETIHRATEQFLTNRESGIRGSRSVFSTGADAVNAQTIAQAGLAALPDDMYDMLHVGADCAIRPFVESHGVKYVLGRSYYQLTKTEDIQVQKEIAIVEKSTGNVFVGRAARGVLGLPDMSVRVKPNFNPDYDIYVQSTSVNRKLKAGTKVLVLS